MEKMRLLASLLVFLLFLFMANPCVGASGREMVVVFKGNQTEILFGNDDGVITKRTPRSFRVPAFVGGTFNNKDLLVLLCNAHYKRFSDRIFIEAVARTSYGNHTSWSDAEILAKNTQKSKTHSVMGELTAVMKDDKIYVLAPSWDASNTAWVDHRRNTGWDPLMIVGTVMNRAESEGGGVYVKWDKEFSLKDVLPKSILGENMYQFVGGVGNGVVTKNGTIVFPIQIAKKKRSQYASSIMYSTNDGSSWHIGELTGHGISEVSVTEWGHGKLLLSARNDRGYRKAFESNDMGTTWKESLMFSGVWGNNQYRMGDGSQGSLITVPVDGNDVLLFSHPLNTKGEYEHDTLQMWMSDGQRIKCVGTISENGKGERSGYSILAHVGDHLYSAHEINPCIQCRNYNAALKEWDRVIALSPLPDLFNIVKNTARAWRKVDAELEKIHVPTNGLVGFLSGGNNNTVWKDEYKSVHAIVKGATPVQGGLRFDGTPGSGAQWPVQSQGQNQVYIFTEKQFTLAATVTIHDIKRYGNHWLLGASENEAGTKVLMALGYTQDEGWYVAYSGSILKNTSVSFYLNKEYHLAITYDHGDFDVYVDGVSITNGYKRTFIKSNIRHFYIGGIVKSTRANAFSCTINNVMLYNRVLNKPEIDKIKNVDKYNKQKESMSTTTPTVILENHKPTAMVDHKETSDLGTHIIHFDDEDDESEEIDLSDIESSEEDLALDKEVCDGDTNDVRHHSNGRDSKKGHKGVDGAVESISFTTWMFFAYSAIVLAWL